MTFSGHEMPFTGATTTWLTPKYIIDDLGPFDSDPCPAPEPRPWETAKKYGVFEGFCFMNPPYGDMVAAWMKRFQEHNNGIALVFARTDTRWFHDFVFSGFELMFFLEGRIKFCYADGTEAKGNAGAPSVLVGYGAKAVQVISNTKLKGKIIWN